MKDYNYRSEMFDDIKCAIEERGIKVTPSNRDEVFQSLYDDLWCDDSVTGNASGSYTFSTYRAEEYLCHNWDLLEEALSEFGSGENPIEKGAEWCDVTIRCYLLGECLSEVLDELEEEDESEEDEDWEEEDDE